MHPTAKDLLGVIACSWWKPDTPPKDLPKLEHPVFESDTDAEEVAARKARQNTSTERVMQVLRESKIPLLTEQVSVRARLHREATAVTLLDLLDANRVDVDRKGTSLFWSLR